MKIKLSRDSIKKLTGFVGVYSFLNKGKPMYIGKSVNIKARLLSHLENAKIDKKERAIFENSDSLELFITDSEFKALILESRLIQTHHPRYNTRWKDDKSYLYIKIGTKDTFPKIKSARRENERGFRYFGPFPSTQSVDQILKEIRRVFPFCTQNKIGRQPCFYSKIGLCNPCPSNIEKISNQVEKKKAIRLYRSNLRKVIKVLEGKADVVEGQLIKELKKLTQRENYEDAIDVRNRLYYFQRLIHQQFKAHEDSEYNQSEKALKELLYTLKPYFPSLEDLTRIECYDISNLVFKEATASMVVMEDGIIAKDKYRRFKIKNPKLKSDFDMLDETLNRRLKTGWPLPSVFIIDGGTPQITKVREVFKRNKIKVPIVGIAKHPDRLIAGVQGLPRIRIGENRLGFNLVRRLRDESHRFARKYHLLLRDKSFLDSSRRYN